MCNGVRGRLFLMFTTHSTHLNVVRTLAKARRSAEHEDRLAAVAEKFGSAGSQEIEAVPFPKQSTACRHLESALALGFRYLVKCAAVFVARHRSRFYSFPHVACAVCTYDDAAAMHRHKCLQLCRCYSRTMSSLLKAQGSETRSIFSGSLPDQLDKKGLRCVPKCPIRCHTLNLRHLISQCTRLSKTFATNAASSSGQDAVAHSEASACNGATTGDKAPHVPVLLQQASLCCNLHNTSIKAGVWESSAAAASFCFQAGSVQLRRAAGRDICGWHSGRWRALCSHHKRAFRDAHAGGH